MSINVALSLIHISQEWTRIPVPAIVEVELFEAAALQLEENRRRSRAQGAGPRLSLIHI